MNDMKRVLVVGGGVGGLSAAIFFARRGVEVTLIERRPNFDVPGVGLGQPANALRVYDALGVLDQVLERGYIYDHMSIYDADHRLIAHHKFLLGDDRTPPVCALRRSDLHDILLTEAQRHGVTLRLGLQVTEIQDEPGRVSVTLSDGRRESFDLLAGFDGIRSTTREHVVGDMFQPRHCGVGAWRLQVPRPSGVTGMEFIQGLGCKTGAMPIARDLMYLFHICPEPADAVYARATLVDRLRERLAAFGGYVAEISAGLNDASEIVYGPLEPMLVPWPWHRGRVVIGGDAAHVVPPHLTQGAAMAVEDGLLLAHEMLQTDAPVEQRLMRYSQKRYSRCAFVYSFARDWLDQEQSIRTPAQMEVARQEMARNASSRIGVSDRILNTPIL
ncbi:MAG: 2-polyprenyl-6-methoxyphenol hydroxylase [Bradyrhizobium sp.]|jgi:2-polyprenyl-6-methoxyphenol hydroxylase-like FAD-dependent oxidoreductase|nr:2-polyprenyl-6-methoxyphenol hydroxylase [Bradyrhizobium sp.]